MSEDIYRILIDHDDCIWHGWMLTNKVRHRDPLDSLAAISPWWRVFRCANFHCPAEAIVSDTAIVALLPEAP